jgi:hypothetical protein
MSALPPCKFVGMPGERWYFFAQADHPHSLYYQAVLRRVTPGHT